MDVEFITDMPGRPHIVRSQQRPMSGRLPEWVVLEATKMGGKPEDGLWHYRRVQRPVTGTGEPQDFYYVFDHEQG